MAYISPQDKYNQIVELMLSSGTIVSIPTGNGTGFSTVEFDNVVVDNTETSINSYLPTGIQINEDDVYLISYSADIEVLTGLEKYPQYKFRVVTGTNSEIESSIQQSGNLFDPPDQWEGLGIEHTFFTELKNGSRSFSKVPINSV